jgi:hypothetical protein
VLVKLCGRFCGLPGAAITYGKDERSGLSEPGIERERRAAPQVADALGFLGIAA